MEWCARSRLSLLAIGLVCSVKCRQAFWAGGGGGVGENGGGVFIEDKTTFPRPVGSVDSMTVDS